MTDLLFLAYGLPENFALYACIVVAALAFIFGYVVGLITKKKG